MAESDLILLATENVEAYNAGDWERLRAVLAPDVVYDEVGTQRHLLGADKMVEAYKGWKEAAPDGRGNIIKAFASGRFVTLEVMWTGTHTGPLAASGSPIPPTGKSWNVLGAQVIRFDGNKIKEFRQYFDMLTLLQQIGVTPAEDMGMSKQGG